ncbi:NUDIX hydrolase [Emcibacter nanhaiensis]|uniref:NUDIX hydrolase n=1 Tax=Emcibacter nanhaiensis TaxID=1505037 RepID=A0A501PR18_9PROT|nr:NUDIX hydrolase [Emcibacter nanhaiensis]TPD62903.1 NUDIX hydrolase [Emcibacter nanhaiensis]
MSSETKKIATPIDSATVILVRDGYDGLEVLVGERHGDIKFAGGARVFPGGKVDPLDKKAELEWAGETEEKLPEQFRGLRFTAIREVFEETGLIIAKKNGYSLTEDQRAAIDREYRDRVHYQGMGLLDFMKENGLGPDLEACVPFAHWITPVARPKRFDTRFFVCEAPEGQVAKADGQEIIDVIWATPTRIIEEADGTLMFPTLMNLKKIAEFGSVRELMEDTAGREIVTVLPEIRKNEAGEVRIVAEEAGYGSVDQNSVHPGISKD